MKKFIALLPALLLLCSLAPASSTSGVSGSTSAGSGTSNVCAGFAFGSGPLCSPTGTGANTVVLPTLPAVNTVFISPAGRNRTLQLTQPSTALEPLQFGCCNSSSSGEDLVWSQPDPSNRDGLFVYDNAGAALFYCIDRTTMAVKQYTQAASGSSCNTAGNPNGFGSRNQAGSWGVYAFSQNLWNIVYGFLSSHQTYVLKYDLSADRFCTTSGCTATSPATAYVDFASCPNFPTVVGSGGNNSVLVRQDRYASMIVGGAPGQFYYLAAWEDTNTGNCYWMDTVDGLYGGTGISGVQTTSAGQIPTPGKPTLSTTGSGGTTVNICAKVTANDVLTLPSGSVGYGETVPSVEATTTATTGQSIVVNFASGFNNPYQISLPGNNCGLNTGCNNTCNNMTVDTSPCQPYRVYLSQSAGACTGTETLQNSGNPVSGPTFTIAVASITNTGAVPPTTQSAGFTMHESYSSLNGLVMNLGNSVHGAANTLWPWTPGTSPPLLQVCPGYSPTSNADCEGHHASGSNGLLEQYGIAGGAFNQLNIEYRPYCNTAACLMSTVTAWPSPIPTPTGNNDAHVSWPMSAYGDSRLGMSSNYATGVTGNSSTDMNSNSCTHSPYGWLNELIVYSPLGPVYRVGKHYGTGCINPGSGSGTFTNGAPQAQMSPDGHFIDFTSVWGWTQGTLEANCVNASNYPSSTWQPHHSYGQYQCIYDGNNYEIATTAGTSASVTQPSWPGTSGQTTPDGTGSLVWTMVTGASDPNNSALGNNGLTAGYSVFVTETY